MTVNIHDMNDSKIHTCHTVHCRHLTSHKYEILHQFWILHLTPISHDLLTIFCLCRAVCLDPICSGRQALRGEAQFWFGPASRSPVIRI